MNWSGMDVIMTMKDMELRFQPSMVTSRPRTICTKQNRCNVTMVNSVRCTHAEAVPVTLYSSCCPSPGTV